VWPTARHSLEDTEEKYDKSKVALTKSRLEQGEFPNTRNLHMNIVKFKRGTVVPTLLSTLVAKGRHHEF
jgi:hypothetical protein